ncbi:MAG: DUF4173 domain-containing protein [Burkholderiales bacterium]|nr:DUF4173 domain-containing protein [Bacteroidia bacterium]
MKKNDYLLLLATGAYSFLFYQQNAGINFLLFTIILQTIIIVRNNELVKNKKWLWSAALCLVSAVAVFINSSSLSIIANVFSLLLLSAVSFNVSTSGLFSFLFSCYSVVSVTVFMIIDSIKRLQAKNDSATAKSGYKVIATFLALLLSIIFFNMYKSSNPLFAENTKWINLDFISFNWICFTISGCLLTYAFLYHRVIAPVEKWENNLPLLNKTGTENEQNKKQFEIERYAGLLLFVMLNLMLVILNCGDIQTLYFNGGLPKNITHSDFVHSGVGIIILSIILATSLIMYLFRKEFTNVKNNKALMIFVYLWIAQNVLMLSSTALRNQIYIHDFNFTYKRIGVYIWLALAALGLLIILWKIYKKRSNWYLIKTNVAVWFTTLALCSLVNWDKLITGYNIQNKPIAEVDFYYLFSLSDANIPELMAVTKSLEFAVFNSKLSNYKCSYYNERYYSETCTRLLNQKIYHYLYDYTNDWRSFDLRDKQILESIYKK